MQALVYDLNSAAKLCYPWPGGDDDILSGSADADKAAILLLMGFNPRPGTPTFGYKLKRETEVNYFKRQNKFIILTLASHRLWFLKARIVETSLCVSERATR